MKQPLFKLAARGLATKMVLRQRVEPVQMAYASYESTALNEPVPPLLVMHGLFGSKGNWNSLCKAMLQRCRPQRKIIAVDARNHGDSPHSSRHSYVHLAEDIKAFLDSFKIEKAALMGHSMGGRAVMFFALKYPELVDRMIVVDISPVGASPTLKSMPQLFEVLARIEMPASGSASAAKTFIESQLSLSVNDKGLRAFLLTNVVQDDKGGFKWRVNLPSLITNFKKIASFPTTSALTYNGSSLFIGGSASDYLPKVDHPHILDLFPKAEFKYIDGAGHWLHSEKPKEFLDIAVEFINRPLS